VEIEKTVSAFILRISTEAGVLLKEATVALNNVWNEDNVTQDYLVIGEPHENYYQGSMKIKEITF